MPYIADHVVGSADAVTYAPMGVYNHFGHFGSRDGLLVVALDSSGQSSQRCRSATEAAQIVWTALHGAVTIEHAKIGRTENPAKTYEDMVNLLLGGMSALARTRDPHDGG